MAITTSPTDTRWPAKLNSKDPTPPFNHVAGTESSQRSHPCVPPLWLWLALSLETCTGMGRIPICLPGPSRLPLLGLIDKPSLRVQTGIVHLAVSRDSPLFIPGHDTVQETSFGFDCSLGMIALAPCVAKSCFGKHCMSILRRSLIGPSSLESTLPFHSEPISRR